MKIEKHIQAQLYCDQCGTEFTAEREIDYFLYDVGGNRNKSLKMNITRDGYKGSPDICQVCLAKAMFFGILRFFSLGKIFYPLFKDKKDTHGMENFIKKILIPRWGPCGGVNWSRLPKLRKEKKR